MRPTIAFFVVFSLLSSAHGQAQITVSGRVLATTGKPVPGARIEFEQAEASRRWMAISDVEGRYSIALMPVSTAVGETVPQSPTSPALQQNYPNPSASTILRHLTIRRLTDSQRMWDDGHTCFVSCRPGV